MDSLYLALALAAGVSFVCTAVSVPWLIRNLRRTTAMGRDLNKPGQPLIPEMGGLAVIIGFYAGVSVLLLVARESLDGTNGGSALFDASLLAVLGAGFVGIMDDLFNLRQRVKAVLPFLFALPLGAAAYVAGDTALFGIDIGILMALAIPFGLTAAANAANMLEGFNGLGAGLGIIMAVSMIGLSVVYDAREGLFLLFPLLGALLAFLPFNYFPARIFPGDSMTLFLGATMAAAAIISTPSLKLFGALLFLPMIVEFFLKLRGHFRGENYGRPDAAGRLFYGGRTESLAHWIMKRRRPTERALVHTLWLVEAVLCLAVVGTAALVAL